MSYPSTIDILLYTGGNILQENNSVRYDRPASNMMRIPRTTKFLQLTAKIHEVTGINRIKFLLKLSAKYSFSRERATVLPIKDDQSLAFFLDPVGGFRCLELYIEKEEMRWNVPEISTSFKPRSFMSLLTQVSQADLSVNTPGSSNIVTHSKHVSVSTREKLGALTPSIGPNGNRERGKHVSVSTREKLGALRPSIGPNGNRERGKHVSVSIQEKLGVQRPNFQSNSNREHGDAPRKCIGPEPSVGSSCNFVKDDETKPDGAKLDSGCSRDEVANPAKRKKVQVNEPMPPAANGPKLYPVLPFFTVDFSVPADSIGIPDKTKLIKLYDPCKGVDCRCEELLCRGFEA